MAYAINIEQTQTPGELAAGEPIQQDEKQYLLEQSKKSDSMYVKSMCVVLCIAAGAIGVGIIAYKYVGNEDTSGSSSDGMANSASSEGPYASAPAAAAAEGQAMSNLTYVDQATNIVASLATPFKNIVQNTVSSAAGYLFGR